MDRAGTRPDDAGTAFEEEYGAGRRLILGLAVVALGVLVAGFWNYHLVDGFGRDVVAGRTIGDTGRLAGRFVEKGGRFGFLFGAVAGLAATFTACNCVAFAMLPGLACPTASRGASRSSAGTTLAAFTAPVLLLGAAYGVFIGFVGPEGVEAMNERPARIARARTVFSLVGLAMVGWGIVELGFLRALSRRLPPRAVAFFRAGTTRAALLGSLVGLFAVGRPFPVFREFLTYAATAESPLYGAAVMTVHGAGQIAVLLGLFLLLVWVGGDRMARWASEKPHEPRMVTALALLAGGAFFVFYWGIALAYDVGRWGFKLGWY